MPAPLSTKADDPAELDAVESAYLGRSGELRKLLGEIGKLPGEDRPKVGALANPIREELEASIAARRSRLNDIAYEVRLARERVDVTLPGRSLPRGSLHPLIETQREIARIFGQFGFVTYESPEVESDELSFQLLNIPEDHPARDLWDTLYVAGSDRRLVLRPHTSPGQIRIMREYSAADPRHPARSLLPLRDSRRQPRLRVLPGRGADGRRGHDDGHAARPARRVRPRHVRRRHANPVPPRLLPVHRAVGRVRHQLPDLRRHRAARRASEPAG